MVSYVQQKKFPIITIYHSLHFNDVCVLGVIGLFFCLIHEAPTNVKHGIHWFKVVV
jgi:hypothetical protein